MDSFHSAIAYPHEGRLVEGRIGRLLESCCVFWKKKGNVVVVWLAATRLTIVHPYAHTYTYSTCGI